MNTQTKTIFRGTVVNKAPTINTGVNEFPRYAAAKLTPIYFIEEVLALALLK